MSIQDMIKKSVLESGVFDSFNAPKMAISLIVALLLGAVIYMVYSKFYVGVIFSRSFAVTLVGMTLLTCMVTLAISTNIVISGNRDYQVKGAVVVHSIEEALKEVEKYPAQDVYCIGGDSIYRQMLPYCDVAHVTKIDFAYEADAHFPNLDEDSDWEVTAESEEQTYFDLEYTFMKYERKNK